MLAKTAFIASIVLLAASAPALAQTASADIADQSGKSVGKATLTETPSGVLLRLSVTGLPPGVHAFHIHAAGKCEPPFDSATGHFNPGGKKHGALSQGGQHAGDMPNLYVPSTGSLEVEVINTAVTLAKGSANSLLGPSGTALIIHAGTDDYTTDPTGNAGGRIACGVIKSN